MFGFLLRKKQDDVRKLLQRTMNRSYMQQFRYGPRQDSRGSLTDVAIVFPLQKRGASPEFERAFTAITKDISTSGLSIVCRDVDDRVAPTGYVLLGISDDYGYSTLLCQVRHVTDLGYGYRHIGLWPEERVQVSASHLRETQLRLGADPAQVMAPASAG